MLLVHDIIYCWCCCCSKASLPLCPQLLQCAYYVHRHLIPPELVPPTHLITDLPARKKKKTKNNQPHVSSRPIKPRTISIIIIITTRRKLPKIFPTTIRRSMMMSHDNSHIRLMQNIFPRLMHFYIPTISFHNLQHSTDIFSSFGVNFI